MKMNKQEEMPKDAPEGYHYVQNLMTGVWVLEPIDKPWSCSVASESYWCN